MLIKWPDNTYSVIVGDTDGEITVWHPTNEFLRPTEGSLTRTTFNVVYNESSPSIAEFYWAYGDSRDFDEYTEDFILNDYEVIRDTN